MWFQMKLFFRFSVYYAIEPIVPKIVYTKRARMEQ